MYFTYLLFTILCVLNMPLCTGGHNNRNNHRNKNRDPHIKRPENGTGTILISYENVTLDRNEKRILVVFDLVCVDNIDETDERLMNKINHIRERYINCIDLFNLSAKHYDTANYSYVWMDLKCPLQIIQQKKNITINYDELCIEYIMYEPLFWPNQTTSIPITTSLITPNTTQPTHECINMSTDITKSYGLDLLDSPWLDGRFSYVDIDTVRDNPDGLDIFVIDSGIQSDHIEFADGQVVHVMGDGPASTETPLGTIYDFHGTHVAGTASGMNYGSSRGLKIYDYRVCEFDEELEVPCYTSLITDAMDRILNTLKDNPSRRGVINLSLGGEKSFAMNDLYHSYFDRFLDAGGIPVVAAGNEDQDACNVSPAYSNRAITVGAFDIERKKAYFSNWGNCVDIWGPGDAIWSAIPSADSNDKYTFLSGTSMAAPMVTGIVANLLLVQPTLSFDGIMQALKENATSVTFDKCDEYECLAPIYACDKRKYGDPIPFKPNMGLTTWQIVLIVIGCLILVFVVIVVILYITKDKKEIKHTTIPDKENPNVDVMGNEEEQQAIIAETENEGIGNINNFTATVSV